MPGLTILQILGWLAAIAFPFVAGAGILWLKSLFPTRAELKAVDDATRAQLKAVDDATRAQLKAVDDAARAGQKELEAAAAALEKDMAGRFERGSRKFAEHDRRLALVEEECRQSPTRNDLNQGMAVLAGRMSGVESGLKGVEKQLGTQHDYLRTLLERAPSP